ncbi:MAG: FkbM family methyltransferase [Desulfovibrionaceae bacterium]|jgi:FkbM family methyltransferase|nr:FkbM family methyltransferase [Desulfovibrionaceae bacterium]
MPQDLQTVTLKTAAGQRRFVAPRLVLGESLRILQGRTYPSVPFVDDVRTVLDVGANVGASAVYFAAKYPDATVHACEPASEPFALLRHNTEGLAVRAHQVGLWSEDGSAELRLGAHSSLNNSLAAHAHTAGATETVELRHAGDFVRSLDAGAPDVLKIDTEGCELAVLRSLGALLADCRLIYLEFHSEEDRRAIDELLAPTMRLLHGRIVSPHRGTLCYVARDLADAQPRIAGERIVLPG